jgi:hypothetical protein
VQSQSLAKIPATFGFYFKRFPQPERPCAMPKAETLQLEKTPNQFHERWILIVTMTL